MKNQMMKMGVVAALVLGASTMAHAATNSTLQISGKITKATCDVSLDNIAPVDLGTWLPADFTGNNIVGADTRVLTFTGCTGQTDDAGAMNLKLTATDQSSSASAADLWADAASVPTNVGIDITATGGFSASGTAVTPDNSYIPLSDKGSASGTDASSLTINPVTLKMGLKAINAGPVQPGNIKSVIVASAVYN